MRGTMPLKSFLKAVLPGEGFKCWVEISKNKHVTQGFVATIEELAEKLSEIDSRGIDAYFGCAAFTTPRNRRAGNAAGAKSFWLDIDVGEEKPYATIADAIQACDQFCDRAGIPIPGIVFSGGGIHAYWPLDRLVAPADWLYTAQRFKLLTSAFDFHCDPSRTADIASILRPPGTKNYKLSIPREVALESLECFESISFEEFSASVLKNIDGVTPKNINTPSTPNSTLTAGIQLSKFAQISAGVSEGGRNAACATYAGGLLAKGYPADEVLKGCLQWNELNQPPLPAQEVHTTVASICRKQAAAHPPWVDPAETLPALPWGFQWGSAGQLMAVVLEDGEDDKKIEALKMVSQLPVYMDAWMNEEGHKQKNSYLFKQYHPVKGFQEIIINCRDFNGQNWYGLWTENGGSIIDGSDKLFKTYARRHENMLRIPGREITRYSQFGWKNDDTSFLIGNTLCHADGSTEKAYGTDKLSPLMDVMRPASAGSREAWTRAGNKLGMPGMEPHLCMVLAAMAAPLLKFCVGDIDGGAIMSFVSEDSGVGKSPMATACASVWGKLAASIDTGNFTENRRIEDLVRHCHLPLIEEEMPYCDPQIAADGVKKFTSGSDRGRLNRSGAAQGIPERYQTMLLSISNRSLYQLVRMVDVPMSRRVFEIEVERPDKDLLSNLGGITREMVRNCGHVGLQLARLLVEPSHKQYIVEHLTGATMTKVGTTQLKYRNMLNSQPEHRYIIWPLSCIDVIARIVNHHKLLEFNVERVMDWLCLQAVALINDRSVISGAITKLIKFINEHAENCLTVAAPYQPAKGPQLPLRLPRGIMAMRMELNPARLLVTNDALQKWCNNNSINFVKLGKELADLKIVTERSKMVTLTAGTEIPGGRMLCMEVDMAHPEINGQLRALAKEDSVKMAEA